MRRLLVGVPMVRTGKRKEEVMVYGVVDFSNVCRYSYECC